METFGFLLGRSFYGAEMKGTPVEGDGYGVGLKGGEMPEGDVVDAEEFNRFWHGGLISIRRVRVISWLVVFKLPLLTI